MQCLLNSRTSGKVNWQNSWTKWLKFGEYPAVGSLVNFVGSFGRSREFPTILHVGSFLPCLMLCKTATSNMVAILFYAVFPIKLLSSLTILNAWTC